MGRGFFDGLRVDVERLKIWMQDFGHNRAWLAAQCLVTPGTVNGWFSSRPIPAKVGQIISLLMLIDRLESGHAAALLALKQVPSKQLKQALERCLVGEHFAAAAEICKILETRGHHPPAPRP